MPSDVMVHGWRKRFVKAALWLDILRIALRCYRGPLQALLALRDLDRRRARAREGRDLGNGRVTYKYVRASGRYFWDLYSPGWPSRAFDRYLEEELNRSRPFRPQRSSLQVLLMAVTKACPLSCDHCFEWDALNRPETLASEDLKEILRRFLEEGVAQVQFSGGEPLRRFADLRELIALAQGKADTWIITSGFGLTEEKAGELKRAGLTGVLLSLEDWNPDRHNRFRGSSRAFASAESAAAAARQHGLVLGLSLCATREFATAENLRAYAELGRKWGAGFIQIIEPKAVGHYAGRDVALEPAQEKLLEKFHLDLAYAPEFKGHPSAAYQGFAQRREGCGGAARRYLYVDTDGLAHACPFCREPAGHCLGDSMESIQEKLREDGCPRYPQAEADLRP
jgi:MoaA/NifB/PqqE/SkfB family radical SAM enzyme